MNGRDSATCCYCGCQDRTMYGPNGCCEDCEIAYQAGVKAEREECAAIAVKVVDKWMDRGVETMADGAGDVLDGIRARTEGSE